MPTWKSPLSAASLPSRTRSCPSPASAWSRTTAAISRATSAGPNRAESASTWVAAVHPTARADRSCSTASASPRVSTLARPPVAAATWTASSTAHSSWLLIVKPAYRPSTAWASSVSTTSPDESTTRLMQTSTSAMSADPLVAGVEEPGGVGRAHRHRVELLHVGHRQLVADHRLVGRQVGHQQVLAQRGRGARGGDVGVVAVAVGERAAVAGEDRLPAQHVALRPAGRGVVVDRERAEHRGGQLLALAQVGLLADEVGGLDLGPLHPGLDDGPLAVELEAEGAVALLDPAGRPVDADADRHRAVRRTGLQQTVPDLGRAVHRDVELPAELADVGDPRGQHGEVRAAVAVQRDLAAGEEAEPGVGHVVGGQRAEDVAGPRAPEPDRRDPVGHVGERGG